MLFRSKGLEPFNFREWEGCFDFAVALSPEQIFDEDLGPTLIVEKSPLEMLREKLDEVRQDVTSAVQELQQSSGDQKATQVAEADGSKATEVASPDNPSSEYSEKGKEGTEIAQQTAELEDNLPEDSFMEDGKISRKHVKGANGQVMQVVENVYDEQHKEATAERKAAADRALEAKRLKKEGQPGKAKMVKRFGKEEDKLISEDHSELEYDEVSYKTNPSQGVVKFGKKSEPDDDDDTGRYETARSAENGYVDRMKTGKATAAAETGRFKTAKSGTQDADRMHTADSDEQDADRMHTAKESEMAPDGEERWAGQADNYERVNNMDQYDVDAKSYGVNAPKTSQGADPYGRQETETKIPVESEEMPDDEVFAVQTTNVMSDKSMRVIRQKSSDARPKSVGTHNLLYAEPQADEMTGPEGVTTAPKSMRGSKMVEHAEYDQGEEIGRAHV